MSFTPDKELNILIYRTPSYVIIWKLYTFKNGPVFLAHPVFILPTAKTYRVLYMV